jgi:arginine/ornithine N-succinyltransferase beta subunit
VATTDLADFRCIRTDVGAVDGGATITLGREAREVLGVETGTAVRIVLLDAAGD